MAQKPASDENVKSKTKVNVKVKTKAKTQVKAKPKTKTKSTVKVKTTAKTNALPKKKRKNANLAKLCSEMSKISVDAVDKEIIKRFKTMIDTYEDDITKVSLTAIMKDPKSVDLNNYNENLQPYIKHYLFMAKRDKK